MPSPVIVVGAGPVGQTAALLLARHGLRVLLLERRPERDPIGSKAICQQRDVLDVWDSVGAGAIWAEGLTWTTARTYYRDRELFAWSFVDRGRSPLPPFVNLSQARTEQVLDACIAATPAIELRWNHDVTALDQDARGVTLRCRTPGGPATLRAPYVLACTGGRDGVVRSALGVSLDGRGFDDRFLICDIRAELPGWERERRFYFDPEWNPGRQVLIHPCPDSTYRIDWQVPPDFDLPAEEAAGGLDRRIRMILGEVPYEIVWRSVYRFHSRRATRMRVGRVLLAGDAAHLYAPFGARGLNSGVQDAENAAWKIAYVLRGWAPDALLDGYDVERSAAAAENLAVTSATMRFLVPQGEAEWQRRRGMLAEAAADPAARDRVDSGRFAEPFWYVDSPLTTPEPTRPFPGRPPKGHGAAPGPGIIVPDVPIHLPGATRLRQLLREGFTVLAPAGCDVAALAAAAAAFAPVPVRVLDLRAIDEDGEVSEALDARPGEAWLVRPDAHAAAVLPDAGPDTLTAALNRALARRASRRVPERTRGGH